MAIIFKNISFSYLKQKVLENVNFEIQEKEFTAIIGPNGGGKTTLLKLILAQIKPQTGTISLFGSSPFKRSISIGYVPQYSKVNEKLYISVEEVVAMGAFETSMLFPFIRKKVKEKVHLCLKKVRLEEYYRKNFNELSGGQKQRVMIARALISAPKLLILDEPTASVDSSVENDIYMLLSQLKKDMTILLVSHDVGVVSDLADKVICVNKSVVCHQKEEVISHDVIEKMYHDKVHIINHQCKL